MLDTVQMTVPTHVIESESLLHKKCFELADPKHLLTSDLMVTVTLFLVTAVGRLILRRVRCYVVNEMLKTVLIGKDVQAILGIDPEERLQFLVKNTGITDVDVDELLLNKKEKNISTHNDLLKICKIFEATTTSFSDEEKSHIEQSDPYFLKGRHGSFC